MKKVLLNIRDRMFKLSEDEPLSPLSILVLIFLDIFLLTVLFQGLDAQSRLLTSPDDFVPVICQEIIIDKEWNENNRLDKLSDIVVMDHRSTYDQSSRPKNIYPLCKELVNSLNRVKTDKFLINLFEDRDRLISLQKEIRNKFQNADSLPEVKKDPKYLEVSNKIDILNQRLNSNKKILNLWSIIDKSILKQELVIKALRNYRFLFPVYEILFQSLFLFPLLALFYFWYKKSDKKRLQGIISTHLLIVVSIPIFLKIVQFVLDIIPQQIIKKFIDILDSLQLIAIWYYIVIGISIGISILLIYFLQKHLFNREKTIEKRIRNGNCVSCGKKLPNHDRFCSSCGTTQYKACQECNQLTYINSKYCRACGRKTDK